jgi:MFS family permease
MSKGVAATLAWVTVASIPVSIAAGLWIISLSPKRPLPLEQSASPFVFTAIFGFGAVGALIVSHHPRHAVGWIYCLAAAVFGLAFPTTAYSDYATAAPGVLPAAGLIGVVAALTFIVGFTSVLTFALLLFPTGRLPSQRWRPVAWLAVGAIASTFAISVLVNIAPSWRWLYLVPNVLLPLAVLGSVASLFARWRAARDLERQQLKWMAASSALLAIALVVGQIGSIAGTWPSESEIPFTAVMLALTFFPVSAGIAILRYRLYDIDVLINRTFVYGSLVAILAGLYAASIQLFKVLFVGLTGDESDATIVITTLILATTFTPIKTRLEEIARRRFKEPADAATGGADGAAAGVDALRAELRDQGRRLERLEDAVGRLQ